MQLQYEDDFLESAVFLAASGRRRNVSPLLVRRFHAAREKLYSIPDPEERAKSFFELHLDWFREWELEKGLISILSEFPLLREHLNHVVFRKARGRNEEGAELYVHSSGGRNGVVALRPERFVSGKSLNEFLRHELSHLRDMIDPCFGYSLRLPAQALGQERLTRDRYRLLWDITIDGRLVSAGKSGASIRENRWREFQRAYSFWPEEKRQDIFETLWNDSSPRHEHLMQLASDPRDLSHSHQPLPGGLCPLCGFPTFDWADATSISPPLAQHIAQEFTCWKLEHGACKRCVETYEAAKLAA